MHFTLFLDSTKCSTTFPKTQDKSTVRLVILTYCTQNVHCTEIFRSYAIQPSCTNEGSFSSLYCRTAFDQCDQYLTCIDCSFALCSVSSSPISGKYHHYPMHNTHSINTSDHSALMFLHCIATDTSFFGIFFLSFQNVRHALLTELIKQCY